MSNIATPASATELKACCARSYQQDAVALILGESYHPGGLELTRRLGRALSLQGGEKVLDVASGPGATAFLLAREFGVEMQGVDLSEQSVASANARAQAEGLADQVRFVFGDAERLPVGDATFDALVCECALCTFPDKAAAVGEMARVLRPGGRLGITDVTIDRARLDEELRGLAGWVACLADARPADEYAEFLRQGGLRVITQESHSDALAKMVEQIDARLVAFRTANLPALENIDFDLARRRTALAAKAVADRIAGYSLLVAVKPG